MKMTLLLCAVWLTCCGFVPAAEPELIFEDDFSEKPSASWTWLRENPDQWRIQDGALEIHAQPGLAHTVKNALLRAAPDRGSGRFSIDVTVTNTVAPTQQFEQAGITWYNDGRPVFKLVKERIGGETFIIPGKKPMKAQTVRLRLIVAGNRWIAQYQPDCKGPFHVAAEGNLPAPKNDQVSIQCYHGPTDAVHWIRFDDFRISRLAE